MEKLHTFNGTKTKGYDVIGNMGTMCGFPEGQVPRHINHVKKEIIYKCPRCAKQPANKKCLTCDATFQPGCKVRFTCYGCYVRNARN